MRTRTLSMTCLAASTAATLSCITLTTPTRVTVLHTTSADRSLREEGQNLNIDHWRPETAPAGLERGFFVVKSDLEWHQRWKGTETERVPVLPADLNFAKEMVFVAAPPDADVVGTEIRTVVSNEGGIHAYVTEITPGVDCPGAEKEGKPNYDIARIPLIDGKDVQFHIESTPGDSCGSAPEAKITCKSDKGGPRDPATYVEKLNVDPGTKVACVVGSFTRSRPVIDLTWTFAGLPLGAATKMIVGSRGTGVTFTPDVFGAYDLQLEVLDDLQRRGTSTAEVTVTPKAPLVVQLVWTKFDPDDDPSTFPRIELAAQKVNADIGVAAALFGAAGAAKGGAGVAAAKKGAPAAAAPLKEPPLPGTPGSPPIVFAKGGSCSVENSAPFCKAERMGFTTVMTLDASLGKMFALGVHFTDDRVQGQAVPCVRSYRAGKLVTDLCDTNARKADTWWTVGVFDGESAKTTETIAVERAQAAEKAAAAAKAASDAKSIAEARAATDAQEAAEKKAAAAQKAAADMKAIVAAAEARVAAARAAAGAAPAASAPPAASAAAPKK